MYTRTVIGLQLPTSFHAGAGIPFITLKKAPTSVGLQSTVKGTALIEGNRAMQHLRHQHFHGSDANGERCLRASAIWSESGESL